jgi:predicted metal-binding protein
MTRIAILYCKRIKDHSCIACAKCFKGAAEGNGEFAGYDDVEIVAMTDCGDCPGLVVPKVKLLKEVTNGLGRQIDVLHLGTCVKMAVSTAACPMVFAEVAPLVQEKFGFPVRLGTHTY